MMFEQAEDDLAVALREKAAAEQNAQDLARKLQEVRARNLEERGTDVLVIASPTASSNWRGTTSKSSRRTWPSRHPDASR